VATRAARIGFLVGLCVAAVARTEAAAEPGVAPDRITFGQSAALTGAAGDLGVSMRRGLEAAFAEANRRGLHGRRLELIAYDDAYEPEAAIGNTKRLIEDDEVFGLIGYVGTPTSLAAVPISQAAGVPFIAPFTGAVQLRSPALTQVINIRASYAEETDTLVRRLIGDRGADRIAVLYQDDSFGRAGLEGVRQALKLHGLAPVAVGSYLRNSTAVKTALLGIRDAAPEAVIVIGAYQPSAVFARWAAKLGLTLALADVSFVGTMALANELGPAGAGNIVSQVVPFPHGWSLPVLAEYRQALKAFDPNAPVGFVSLEGYIAGRLTAAVLERVGPDPTRTAFMSTLETVGRWDIGGFHLRYGPGDHDGSHAVYLTEIAPDGSVVPVEWLTP
jgi:ABC-type branched-subunit amino acid transport system substrate-binding protein